MESHYYTNPVNLRIANLRFFGIKTSKVHFYVFNCPHSLKNIFTRWAKCLRETV